MVQINITIEADGDNALQLLQLLQGNNVPVEPVLQTETETETIEVATPEVTAPIPLNRSMWTEEDDAELVRLWNAGNSGRQCAAALNRTLGAIGNRISRLRNELGLDKVRLGKQGRHLHNKSKANKAPKPEPETPTLKSGKWDTEEDRRLIQLRKKGWKNKAIAGKLNRSESSTKDRARLLIKQGKLKSRNPQ